MIDKLVLKEGGDVVKEIGYIKKSEDGTKHQSNTIYDPNSIARTIVADEYKAPLKIKENVKKGYSEAYVGDTVNCNYLNSKTRRGRVGRDGVANTLTCLDEQAVVVSETEERDEFWEWLNS